MLSFDTASKVSFYKTWGLPGIKKIKKIFPNNFAFSVSFYYCQISGEYFFILCKIGPLHLMKNIRYIFCNCSVCVRMSVRLFMSVSMYACVFLCVCVHVCLYLGLCVCLFVYVSVSACLSV